MTDRRGERDDELKESWRRNHPSEQDSEADERDRRGKGRRA